jgi:hypothetical protein
MIVQSEAEAGEAFTARTMVFDRYGNVASETRTYAKVECLSASSRCQVSPSLLSYVNGGATFTVRNTVAEEMVLRIIEIDSSPIDMVGDAWTTNINIYPAPLHHIDFNLPGRPEAQQYTGALLALDDLVAGEKSTIDFQLRDVYENPRVDFCRLEWVTIGPVSRGNPVTRIDVTSNGTTYDFLGNGDVNLTYGVGGLVYTSTVKELLTFEITPHCKWDPNGCVECEPPEVAEPSYIVPQLTLYVTPAQIANATVFPRTGHFEMEQPVAISVTTTDRFGNVLDLSDKALRFECHQGCHAAELSPSADIQLQGGRGGVLLRMPEPYRVTMNLTGYDSEWMRILSKYNVEIWSTHGSPL